MKNFLNYLSDLKRNNLIAWLKFPIRNDLFKTALIIFISNQIFELVLIKLSGGQFSFLCSWDCTWYKEIAKSGYDLAPFRHEKQDGANWAFFPLFPLIVYLFGFLTGISETIAILIISKTFFLISIYLFIIFCKRYNPNLSPTLCASVLAFNPYSIYGNVGYTEPLFLALTCAFFILLNDKKYLFAGIIGGPLTATRLVGIVAVFSYLTHIKDIIFTNSARISTYFLGLLLIPIGLFLFILFLYIYTGDGLAFIHIQKSWGHTLMNPLAHLIGAFQGTRFQQYVGLITILGIFGAAIMLIKARPELFIFLLISIILPLSSGLTSMPRYIFWVAPFLLFLVEILNFRKLWIVCFPSMLAGLTFMYLTWLRGDIFAPSGAAFVR